MKILRGATKIFRHPKGGALKKLGGAPKICQYTSKPTGGGGGGAPKKLNC